MPKLTEEKIAELRALCEKATPGPWVAGRPDMATIVDGIDSKWIYAPNDQYCAVASGRIDGEWDEVMANAQLIAAARTALPDLLSDLEEARRERDALQKQLEAAYGDDYKD